MFKGRLLSLSNVKAVSQPKISKYRRNWTQEWRFGGKGVYMLNFDFTTPKRHILARNLVF